MSDYAPDESSQQPLGGDANFQNSLDDSANNSIIGKVKSRVSSILPNRLSKWFSPSSKPQNESLNGNLCGENSVMSSRRRRRIEVEEEENYEDDHFPAVFKESCHHLPTKQEQDVDVDDDNENDEDDDSQNSEYEYSCLSTKQTRRDLNVERQPPAKKSRLNVEVHESPYITRHQPLLASTPDVGFSNLRCSSTNSPALRYNYQRYTHLNLYGNQNKKEPPFDFGQQRNNRSDSKPNTDIIDLITNTSYEQDNLAESSNSHRTRNSGISSRRSLYIQSSSSKIHGSESVNASVAHLKRQTVSSEKTDLVEFMKEVYVPTRRTSTTIREVDTGVGEHHENKHFEDIEKRVQNSSAYNGCAEIPHSFTNKRQKIINGTSLSSAVIPKTNEIISVDSASESGESAMEVTKRDTTQAQQRRTGLFNMSATADTRNNSRTSSFGNGLNFYSHLEGRKSLFSGSYHGNSYPINNSTLSLTSLNRRQFNASIYGSTSALSDSRLLNTFSPFYKGKTTYGGAAAYNKYTAGTGASAVRITPTLIRPTSSLSNLSSSNSFTNNISSHVGENSSISSTAKRILDLINDFATPLSDAKKMASNLKANSGSHIPPQAKSRLNENDLNESRSIRLSQVRTPYSKPNVILQPSGNASGRGAAGGILPPIKELQVPTMSQLLQMKKMQNTTEKARKIAQNSDQSTEYTLPDVESYKTNSTEVSEKDRQKHTNKVRSKVTKSLRATTTGKDLQDEEPPPPVNLPNIAFPIMQSVPKIDIQLNKTFEQCKTTSKVNSSNMQKITETLSNVENDAAKSASSRFNIPQKKSLGENVVSTTDNKKKQFTSTTSNSTAKTFKFSEPLKVNGDALYCQNITQNEKDKYKFSPPLVIDSNSLNLKKKQLGQPPLKEGSCIDALKNPFILPSSTSASCLNEKTNIYSQSLTSGFGNQFKKTSNEWVCEICLVRNKSDSQKCIACETPNKNASLCCQSSTKSTLVVVPSFGQQFKKSLKEWECETCMIRNKEETAKCIACETPRKCVPVVGNALPLIKNSFGDTFKPLSGSWGCQTCMISNTSEANECIACQTKKPGSTNTSQSPVSSSQFEFGITNVNKPSNSADDVFKTLAAQQKSSKWECDACMTRNDANRTKCACCEQPKPGTSNAESTSISSTKFEFGATAASKFSFGFGTGPNASKEEDIRQELLKKSEESTKPPLTNFVTSKSDSTNIVGFKFGITPSTNSTGEPKNDVTDGKKQAQGFQIGVSTSSTELKVNEKSTDVSTAVGLECDAKLLTTTVSPLSSSCKITSSAASANTTSVKFSLPSTISTTNINSKDIDKKVTLPVLGFGSSSTSSTTGGFAFDSKTAMNSTAAEKDKSSLESTAFKTPTMKSSGFSFGSTIANAVSLASSVSSSLKTTATITTATTTTSSKLSTATDIKPLFSFGTNTPSTISSSANSTPALSNFVFGSNSTNSVAATTTASSLFGSVTSTSTVTNTTNATTSKTALSTLTTTTAPPVSTTTTNIFGSFSAVGSSNASTTQIFGSSINTPANNNSSTVSSSTNNPATLNTPQFGSFGSKPASNVFGSFGGIGNAGTKNTSWENKNETKSTLPIFGKVASTTTSRSSQSNVPGFVFGSKSVANTTAETSISTTSPVTSTSTTWPKTGFVFGSNAPSSMISTAQTNENENKDVTKPSVFSTFGSSSTNPSNQQQTSSIFGMPKSNTGSSLSSSGTPSAGPTSFSTNLFNTNSAPAATNIFGASSSGNAATPAPAFGSSPFGGTASSTSATPTFGSTAASGTTFGSFGGSTSNTTTNTTEVKKPEAAFSFGAAPTAQNTSGGFNFGLPASTSKPAFNFGSATNNQQPTFNFTGSTETESSTKPFQFGAIPSAPVFSFNRGVSEGTPNAPFQFNAGAAPVSSNIFAPTPTAGAQTAQQAKRKIRAPIRRVTQR